MTRIFRSLRPVSPGLPSVARLAAPPLVVCWIVALAAACEVAPLADGAQVEALGQCTACHGSDGTGNAAPPPALSGLDLVTDLGVGAHQAHLQAGDIDGAVACAACHVVPARIDSAGHIDPAPAEVVFGPEARWQGAQPTWDPLSRTCLDVYCHGAALRAGAVSTPPWTTESAGLGCDGCHGAPPPPPHPPSPRCTRCHPGALTATHAVRPDPAVHINGVVDTMYVCGDCHGTTRDPAPPPALDGSISTTSMGVGAHQAHLLGGTVAAPLPCETCHVVPDQADAPGHPNGLPAEVSMVGLARAAGRSPVWNRDTRTCVDVYCHGASLSGGWATQPVWTRVDGSQIACDGCHGAPPPAPHVPRADCQTCHPETALGPDRIDLASGAHLDGQLQAVFDCVSCHGSEEDGPAPPPAVDGSLSVSAIGVGAHRVHLFGTTLRPPLLCDDCHVVPGPGDLSHVDALPAELAWGWLASLDEATPTWDRGLARCSGVYCHGATLGGGASTTPTWVSVGGGEAACGACHGNPPPLPHPASTRCSICHEGIDEDYRFDLELGLHINGEVDVLQSNGDIGPI